MTLKREGAKRPSLFDKVFLLKTEEKIRIVFGIVNEIELNATRG